MPTVLGKRALSLGRQFPIDQRQSKAKTAVRKIICCGLARNIFELSDKTASARSATELTYTIAYARKVAHLTNLTARAVSLTGEAEDVLSLPKGDHPD